MLSTSDIIDVLYQLSISFSPFINTTWSDEHFQQGWPVFLMFTCLLSLHLSQPTLTCQPHGFIINIRQPNRDIPSLPHSLCNLTLSYFHFFSALMKSPRLETLTVLLSTNTTRAAGFFQHFQFVFLNSSNFVVLIVNLPWWPFSWLTVGVHQVSGSGEKRIAETDQNWVLPECLQQKRPRLRKYGRKNIGEFWKLE